MKTRADIGVALMRDYRLQSAWLAEQGLSIDVNWLAVTLDAGCTPRDMHPD